MAIRIIKNRSDIGAGTRGSDMGIDAIEIAAINKNNDYFVRYESQEVATENESVYNKSRTSFAKRIESVVNQCKRLSTSVKETLSQNNFPIVLSGDHSSALGTISGIKGAYPDKRIGVVWIDAHADLHSPYTTPSGNVHGMPLAAAIGHDNKESSVNNVIEKTINLWEHLKNIEVSGAKVNPQDVVFFGVRDTEDPEDKLIERLGIKNYTVSECRYRSFKTCIDEALLKLSECDAIYVSFDVDSMDCDMISKGTGTPVAKGFDPQEATSIINAIIKSEKVVCFELVEVNPLLDNRGNKMAETAFDILLDVTQTLERL